MRNLSISQILLGVIFFFALCVLWGTSYTVDQSQIAVVTRNGAITSTEQAGWHIKAPFIDDVTKFDLSNKFAQWKELEGYSHDQQKAHFIISVNYAIKPDRVKEVYSSWGGEKGVLERIIQPQVFKLSKVAIGQFTAQTSIQERGRLNAEILKILEASATNLPIQYVQANVEDIKFDKAYEDSIAQRMIAEVAVQTKRQELEKEKVEATIKTTRAQADADSKFSNLKAEAEGLAEQGKAIATNIRSRGDAEAAAIEVKGKALASNPALIQLSAIEKWSGALPTQMVPGSAVPFVNITASK